MIKKLIYALLTSVIIIVLTQCNINPLHDLTTEGVETEWALPLIDTRKSFKDLIADFDKEAFLQISADGTLNLHYKGDFLARSSLDLFSQFQNAVFPITDTAMAVPFKMPSGVDIDYVDIKAGKFTWVMFSPDEVLSVNLRIPQLTKNGVAFSKNIAVTRLGTNDSLDLSGYRIDATVSDSIYIYHDARRISNGTRVNLKNSGLFGIKGFEFKFVRGYLGNEVFDAPRDSIKIDFYQQWKRGEVRFADPKMTVTLDNSFGFPVRSMTKVADIISINGNRLPLSSPLNNGVDVNYPSFNEIGQSKRTVVVLDKTNSNLRDIISANPVAFDYDIDGLPNPDPSVKTVGFMTDASAFKLQVELDLPMYLSATTFEVSDTFPFSLNKESNLTYAEFKLITDNGIPVDLALQGYFINDATPGKVIDSLFTSSNTAVLKGASVNAQGLPTSVQTQQTLVKVEAEKLQRLKTANKLVIKYAFSTAGNGTSTVRLTSTQDVRLRLGVKFGVKGL